MARSGRVLLTAALLLSLVPAAHAAGPGSTVLADLPQGLGPAELSGQGNSSAALGERTLSTDGDRAVFVSGADGLSAADDNRQANLFVRDRAADQTLLVNVGLGGAPADRGAYEAHISADGTKVVFTSDATNLVAARRTSEAAIPATPSSFAASRPAARRSPHGPTGRPARR